MNRGAVLFLIKFSENVCHAVKLVVSDLNVTQPIMDIVQHGQLGHKDLLNII